MRLRRRQVQGSVTGAVVLALLAATGSAGLAAPPPASPQRATPSTAADNVGTETPLLPTNATPTGATQVTLLTGDVVSYSPGTGAAARVEVQAVPRPNGRAVSFTTLREGEHLYVFPSDARALVGTGRLDRDMFDVAYLAENGYADDKATTLPVIVQYPKSTGSDPTVLTRRADALPATAAAAALPTVNATAVKVTKAQAGQFWASVDAPQRSGASTASTLDAGVAKIWLNHRTRVVLDQSVPQIGAPAAWQAGYDGRGVKIAVLDTGIDDTHPDLAGKVTDSRSFVDGEPVRDGNGHGTHVASTIVGSGAASNGKYKGVAPGAELIVGKVLNNDGQGTDSEIIAGMQWAAQSGAKIVSISIGGAVTDGTDPVSQTVNELSAQYGTLFVIAAGNNGRAAQQIDAPGAADAALTVAAVDKQDQMGTFSSRGPRRGDLALKPDLAAPGVAITAARADGTELGPVVDEKYTTISGTSMATPHVSGAAAILAQEHPDWTGPQLKAALITSTKDTGHWVHEQGAGRVDVARAIRQQVFASGNVDFGSIAYPQTAPVSRPLTYTNTGDTAVTLDLAGSLRTRSGPAATGMLTVTPSTVTVPAHGSAEVTVTLDVTAGASVWYAGSVRATAGEDLQITSAVAGLKQPRQARINIEVINPAGATDVSYGGFLALRLDDEPNNAYLALSAATQRHSGTLDAGYYSIGTDVTWRDAAGEINHALVTNPTVDLTRSDAAVTFDLRRAQRVEAVTPKAAVPYREVLGYIDLTDNNAKLEQYYNLPYGQTHLWTLPTGSATKGTFTAYTQFLNGVDPVQMTVRGAGHPALHPYYQALDADVARLDGRSTLPLVSGGHGLPGDLDGVDASGRLVLLDLSDLCPGDPPNPFGFPCATDGVDRVENAYRAGAAGVLGYGTTGREFLSAVSRDGVNYLWGDYPIPTMGLTTAEGRMLAGLLARGPVTLDVNATRYTPYVYPLAFSRHDRMPDGRHRVTPADLHAVDNRLHADAPATAVAAFTPALPGPNFLMDSRVSVPAPGTLTSYFGPVSKDVLWLHGAAATYETGESAWSQTTDEFFGRAGSHTQDWGEQPLVPNVRRIDPAAAPYNWQICLTCRNGNMLSVQREVSNNGKGGYLSWARDSGGELTTDMHLYKADGTEIPTQEGVWIFFLFGFLSPYYVLPDEKTDYRLTEDYRTQFETQLYSRTVNTERTFSSERRDDGFTTVPPAGRGIHCSGWFVHPWAEDGSVGPATQEPCQPTGELFLNYDFDLDLDNTLPADSRQTVRVTGVHSQYLTPEPTLTNLKLWLSYDDGAHWQQVTTRAGADGVFTGTFDQPALSKTTGAVSVRAQGVDSAGNTVNQTITRAYGLSGQSHHDHGSGRVAAI